jgi:hypothetical protein
MCKKSVESIDHLLHCEIARELCTLLLNLFGVIWVMPRKVRELLVSWKGQVGCHNILEVWRLAPLCLMWCIWSKWNAKSFKDLATLVVELKNIMFNPFTHG